MSETTARGGSGARSTGSGSCPVIPSEVVLTRRSAVWSTSGSSVQSQRIISDAN